MEVKDAIALPRVHTESVVILLYMHLMSYQNNIFVPLQELDAH